MKIAVFHELPFGGARDAIYYFGKGLSENGVSVDLYYVSEKTEKRDAFYFKNIYFYKFTPSVWSGHNWRVRLYKDTVELFKLNSLHKKIAGIIDSRKYDLVLVNGSKYIEAPFILKYLSTFTYFYCHDPNYRIVYEDVLSEYKKLSVFKRVYEDLNRKLRKKLDRNNFLHSDIAIANSNFAKGVIKKTYGKDSVVSYPGVDTEFFSPGKDKKDIDIFYIGSYEKIDGFDLLKKALEELPKSIILKTRMYEDGWIADKNIIRNLYRRSKIVVCTAVNEPFGSVPIEAMSCGVPVIAVNEGGHKETVINGETGFLIKRDSSILAEKISQIINNKNLFDSRSLRNIAKKKWDWSVQSKKLTAVLRNNIKK